MGRKREGFFWASYTDLMTTLFFVMLVLFAIVFFIQQGEKEELLIIEKKYDEIEEINKDIRRVMDNDLFTYREEINGYVLNISVSFNTGINPCNDEGAAIPTRYHQKLKVVGKKLEEIMDTLRNEHANVDFMMVVAGRSSVTEVDQTVLQDNDQVKIESQLRCNYALSYKRAYSLYQLWRRNKIDFDSEKYNSFLDFHIAGNGFGGAGRYPREDVNGRYSSKSERRNQGFIVEILPKFGDLKAMEKQPNQVVLD